MGKILKLNRDLVVRSMVSKAPHKAKKVRTELAKRIRHETRSKGQARIMVSREVFGSFLKLLVGNFLWFELMRGVKGMPQLEVHDKQSAGAKVKPRVRTDKPSTAGHQICTALRM